jgi:hypothetical protein
MKVKMITTMAGPDGGANPGQIIEVDEGKGKALVAGGFGAEVCPGTTAQPAAPEAAIVAPQENAALPSPKGRNTKGKDDEK